MRNVVLIPNAPILMESMRSIGYSFESAVSDIIDNSISACSTRISIEHNVFSYDPYLAILDDGRGMSENELENAMIYGSINPNVVREKSDLGRFGLGLKSASLSQCKELIVVSKSHGIISCMSWDLDYVTKTNQWSAISYSLDEVYHMNLPNIETLRSYCSGTLVIWRKFDRFSTTQDSFEKEFLKKIDLLQNHLALVFHRFINGDENYIDIQINQNRVLAIDPFLLSNKATQKKPTQILEINGEKIEINPFILPHLNKISKDEMTSLGGEESLRQNQGYYVYRNRRLIIWGKWFGQYTKNELQKLVRVQVDIPNSLDYLWEIDIKKSQASLPYSIRNSLGHTLQKVLNDGKQVFGYRGRKENSNFEFTYIWDRINDRGQIKYLINRKHPIIAGLIDNFGEKEVTFLLSYIEEYLPIQQIYNDQAENKIAGPQDPIKEKLIEVRQILSLIPFEARKQILCEKLHLEGMQLSKEELAILREEFIENEC